MKQDLPVWNLNDLYSDPNSKEIEEDILKLKKMVDQFENQYRKKITKLNAKGILNLIYDYEKICKSMGRLSAYAGLRYYQFTSDPERGKFLAKIDEHIKENSTKLVFFSLEINKISKKKINLFFKENKVLEKYKSAFNRMRALKPFQLNDEMERFLSDKSVVGSSAWNRLFDETMADLKFKVDDQDLGLEEVLNNMSSEKRDLREKSAKSLANVLDKNIKLFSRITNTLIKEKAIEDNWRKFPSPDFSRHLSNDVEPEVVNALRNSVVNSYPEISHRYYKIKAKILKIKKLEIWDRNAPLYNHKEKFINWDKASNIVLEAFYDFDPLFKKIALPFFTNNWIDAKVTKGKAPGAFSHPTTTDVHPYIMINYLGKSRDVMTLAHELGHGIHQTLASRQGEILANTPLTLAETASVFGEMLTFRKMISACQNEIETKQLLARKIEDMLNTLVRQISFYDFECRLHNARKLNELLPNEINKIWLDVSKESLGENFNYMKGYETFWAYIPHFIHSPFYVYAYAFGDALVNALFDEYQNGKKGFEKKYIDMLKAGGSKHHSELLKPFNLNAKKPEFWQKGINLISRMIDDLEQSES